MGGKKEAFEAALQVIQRRAVERSKNLEGLAVIEGLLMENDLLLLLPKSEKAITPFAPPAPTAL